MDAIPPESSPLISEDEDEYSDDDERSDGRRRRFCIERKQQSVSQQSRPRRATDTIDKSRHEQGRVSGTKRKVCSDEYRQQKRIKPITNSLPPTQQLPIRQPQKGPVIFINPRFIKKFIEKSIKLTSSSSNMINTTTIPSTTTTNPSPSSQTYANGSNAASTSASSMIDSIDFKTSPKEALQAASTMAIIRLVTECIEDDSKRDEKFNKTLASRLIESLTQHGITDTQEPVVDDTETADCQAKCALNTYNPGISEEDVSESEGRPIPVIGGSVNHHFNKNVNNYYSTRNHDQPQAPYQRQPRRHSSDRNHVNVKHPEIQKNKLRNYS